MDTINGNNSKNDNVSGNNNKNNDGKEKNKDGIDKNKDKEKEKSKDNNKDRNKDKEKSKKKEEKESMYDINKNMQPTSALRHTISVIASLTTLKSPLAKARAWIRCGRKTLLFLLSLILYLPLILSVCLPYSLSLLPPKL